MKRYSVKLTPKEQKTLLAIVRRGQNKASVIQRAHILLKSDEGKPDKTIAELLYIGEDSVARTRQRFCEHGLDAALKDQAHLGSESKLDDGQEAYLVALACSDAPEGRQRWTLELLAEQLMEDGIVEKISSETVRLVLKKTNSSLGA
jgi:transposase